MENESLKSDTKVENRCAILADILNAVRNIYERSNDDQKALIETTIGAAIWYIPKTSESFSGLISKNALITFQEGKPELSEEHIYPRKVSATELLKMKNVSSNQLLTLYKTKYCKICLITPSENKQAIQHQKVSNFTTPEIAYKNAGIELISITREELKRLKKGDKETVEVLLKRECVSCFT